MAQELQDWLGQVEDRIGGVGHSRDDLIEIIHTCEALLEEMEPLFLRIRDQRTRIVDLRDEYRRLFATRFDQQAPPLPPSRKQSQTIATTPEVRKEWVRKTALRICAPGSITTGEEVLRALRLEGVDLKAQNPSATVSTILYGFKSHFDKVKGRRGVFSRREEPLPD